MTKTLDFKCALITGGGGGLGRAMAEELIRRGKKIIIAGRTESSLKQTASEINAAAYYVLDTGDTASIPSFVSRLTSDHPDLDCVINNAGVQRPLQVLGPDYTFDLSKADQEIDINIRGPMHLIVALLPHFEKQDHAVIMNVSSVLGFIPFSVINPVYNGTKSCLHSFTTNLRTQMETSDRGKHIRVVEIVPPQVESDLHRDRTDPDDNKKKSGASALSVEEFMADVTEGWEADLDTVSAGMGKQAIKQWDENQGARYKQMLPK